VRVAVGRGVAVAVRVGSGVAGIAVAVGVQVGTGVRVAAGDAEGSVAAGVAGPEVWHPRSRRSAINQVSRYVCALIRLLSK